MRRSSSASPHAVVRGRHHRIVRRRPPRASNQAREDSTNASPDYTLRPYVSSAFIVFGSCSPFAGRAVAAAADVAGRSPSSSIACRRAWSPHHEITTNRIAHLETIVGSGTPTRGNPTTPRLLRAAPHVTLEFGHPAPRASVRSTRCAPALRPRHPSSPLPWSGWRLVRLPSATSWCPVNPIPRSNDTRVIGAANSAPGISRAMSNRRALNPVNSGGRS